VQHIEMARDFAQRFNHLYGEPAGKEHFVLPEAVIEEQVATLPGLDGRKMSKSYDNTIPLFAPREQLKRLIFSIVTDSRMPGEVKDTEGSALFQLYQAFASAQVCMGPVGCVCTVMVYAPPLVIAPGNVMLPLVVTMKSAPPLSRSVTEFPWSPLSVPPTVNVASGGGGGDSPPSPPPPPQAENRRTEERIAARATAILNWSITKPLCPCLRHVVLGLVAASADYTVCK